MKFLKFIALSTAIAASLTLSGCSNGGGSSTVADTPVETLQGTVYYTNGDWMGVVNSDGLSSSGRYDILDTNGNKIGEIDSNGMVYDDQGNEIDLCVGEVAYSEEGILVGECTIVDDGRAVEIDDPAPVEDKPADNQAATVPAPAPAECCENQNNCCNQQNECCNNPPVANAGGNKSVEVHHTVTITGTASDSDGTIASIEWTENGNFLSDTLSFDYTPSTTGIHTLTLTVMDDDGDVGSDTMTVNATATPVNQAPEWTQASYNTGVTIEDSTDDSQNIMDLKFVTSDPEGDTITYSIVSISVPSEQIEWNNSIVIESGVLKVKNLMTNDAETNGNVTVTVKAEANGGSNNADITFTFNNVQ